MKHDASAVLIKHIGELCQILEKYHVFDKASLLAACETDMVFQKAVLMSVAFISGLSKKADERSRRFNKGVDWHRLGVARDIIFHDCGIVDMEIISSVIFEDITMLKLTKVVDSNDLKQALELVNEVFSEFVAVDYSEQGQNTFRSYLAHKYEEVCSDMVSGHKKVWACYGCGKILGVIATRDVSHIALMFVDKQFHKKGIARHLFGYVLEEMAHSANVTQITVNSSPYAVKVYERLGFIKTDEQQEKDGILFVPMVCPINKADERR